MCAAQPAHNAGMARRPRLCLPGHPHLVLQRAAAGVEAFSCESDYQDYLRRLADGAQRRGVQVHAWCLLPDAAWLLLTPDDCSGLSALMQQLARCTSRSRGVAVWDGRFRTALLQPGARMLHAIAAVDQAAELQGHAADATSWRWSSLAHHSGGRADAVVREAPEYWALGNTPYAREAAFRGVLAAGDCARAWPQLRAAALAGVAFGDSGFVDAVSRAIGRRPEPGRRGRPRRAAGLG